MAGRNKVTVVGAGNVGATAAHWIASKELADVVLVDIVEGTPQGKSLDLAQAAPIDGFDVKLVGANSYEETTDSDVVIITAGLPRKPGHEPRRSSEDQLRYRRRSYRRGREIFAERIHHRRLESARRDDAGRVSPLGFSEEPRDGHGRRSGRGAHALLPRRSIERFGRERDGVRARRPRRHDGAAAALFDLCRHPDHRAPSAGPDRRDRHAHRERRRGDRRPAEDRLGLLRPFAWCGRDGEAILKDKKKILPCAVFLEGEYGINNLFVGVPVKLGKNGVEQIIEISLTNEERAALQKSAGAVQELIDILEI